MKKFLLAFLIIGLVSFHSSLRAQQTVFTITTTSQANCATLSYTIVLVNTQPTALFGSYQLSADVNGNGVRDPGTDQIIGAGNLDIPAGGTTTLAGTFDADLGGLELVLETRIILPPGPPLDQVNVIPTTSCANLPVRFKSFNAARKNQDVLLTWETASEDNNRGFYVQRNTGRGWQDMDFVASKASDGNSSSVLAYDHTDRNNTTKGVTQYRLMQVDIDGKAKLSDVRIVRGLNQGGRTIVYPNPSAGDKVNVVFEESKSAWNVFVSDISGRTIRQFTGVTNNVLVDNLLPGMYLIRLVELQTGAQTNEKLIVSNR
jgi:hypothetical protein